MFKSKRVSLLTIFALLLPSSAGLATIGVSAANAASSRTALTSLTVNGVATAAGSTVDLPAGTTTAEVVATAGVDASTPTVTGNTGLHVGANSVSIVVDAAWSETVANPDYVAAVLDENGVEVTPASGEPTISAARTDTETFSLTLNVLPYDASSAITIDGELLVNGETKEVDWGTTSVVVAVTPADAGAAVVVTGGTNLVTGNNPVVVEVTASDGVTKETSNINVKVLENTDTSLSSITVNGLPISGGETAYLNPLTTSAVVVATTTDPAASAVVSGNTGLLAGTNDVTISVTAADGVTTEDVYITLEVALNDDVSLSTFTVGGFDTEDGDTIDLDPFTTDVPVVVETNDPDASYVVDGGTDLVVGENDLHVTVYAADGVTSFEYYVVLNVKYNDDASLSTFQIFGDDVVDGDTYLLPAFTTEIFLEVEATDPEATVTYDGAEGLVVGENTLTVTVVAADGLTTLDYNVTLVVAESYDATSVITVTYLDDGGDTVVQEVVDGDEVILLSNTSSVEVNVTPTEATATYEYEGDSDLVVGNNELTVTVTAPDGFSQEIATINLVVSVGDVTTSSFTVNGEEVADGDVVDLLPGTSSVDVYVETADNLADFVLEGDNGLEFGQNHLVLTVTSVDGTATGVYDVILNVLPYEDATVKSITVNGEDWVEGTPVEVDAGDLDVQVEANNEFANPAVITGNTTDVSGLTTLTVSITAQDGVTEETYTVDVLATTELEVVAGSVPTDGTIRVGTYAKLTKDQFAGSKVTYQWLNDGSEIDGATGYRYLITADDFGHVIRAQVVSTTAGVAKTLISKAVPFEAGIIKKAPTPGVKGKAVVGGTLTAVARTWSTDVELAYQWYADGTAIDGATEETFEITPDLVDAPISVGVTGSLTGYATIEKTSAALTVKPGTIRFTSKPSVSGTLEVGETIEVDPGSVSVDTAEVTYVWSRNGEEIDNTEATYTLTADDFKKRITVQVVANAEGYNQASAKVKTTSIKAGTFADAPTPSISGDAIVGEVLTADTGEYPDGTTFKFVWSRNNRVIAGANAEYTVNKRDIGQSIKVRVIATIPGYKTVSILADEVIGAAE